MRTTARRHDHEIGIVDVFVDDQGRARDFHTALLGLEVKVDAAYGDSGRWLTVVSPQARDGTGCCWHRSTTPPRCCRRPDETTAPGCLVHHR